MSLNRIKGILLQEFFIMIHSLEVINDLVFYPIFSNIIIFGFLTVYLIGQSLRFDPKTVLIGMILWQPLWIISYSIGVGTLWNVWSQNLTNIFITPINLYEYFIAYFSSGVIKGIIVVIISKIIAEQMFHVDISTIGLFNMTLYLFNLVFFGLSLGFFILALIFRFGNRIAALSWGLVGILQPLMAVVYPVRILPPIFQNISLMFPPTYIFEAARIANSQSPEVYALTNKALILNIIYLVASILFFNYMFRKSKEVGQFAKLEG